MKCSSCRFYRKVDKRIPRRGAIVMKCANEKMGAYGGFFAGLSPCAYYTYNENDETTLDQILFSP